MTGSGLSAELLALRMRMKAFIDGEVIPAEPVLGEGTDVSAARITELKAEAKRRGLWALGHPAAIGGGDLPFMDFV
jgi:acyl-CoA dehydrogenase